MNLELISFNSTLTLDGVVNLLGMFFVGFGVYYFTRRNEKKREKLEKSREVFAQIKDTYRTVQNLLQTNIRENWVTATRLLLIIKQQKKQLTGYYCGFLIQLDAKYLSIFLSSFFNTAPFYLGYDEEVYKKENINEYFRHVGEVKENIRQRNYIPEYILKNVYDLISLSDDNDEEILDEKNIFKEGIIPSKSFTDNELQLLTSLNMPKMKAYSLDKTNGIAKAIMVMRELESNRNL